MSPPNKREASPQQSKDVCKRLKEDIKGDSITEHSTKEVTKTDDKHITNNNNNNSNNLEENQTNGSAKINEQPVGDVKAEQPKNEDLKINGEKDDEVADEEPKSKDKKQESEINGDKKAIDATSKQESTSDSTTKATEKKPEEEPTSGTLLISGGANWDMTGRKELPKTAKKPAETNPAARSLWGPHRACYEDGTPIRVRGVFSGCNACHSVIVTDKGETMTFGRNDKGQLGLGDTETRVTPVVVEALKGIDIVAAACGRSHTLFLSVDGIVFACGDNKMGQCGTNQQSVQQLKTPARIAFKENKPVTKMACGAEFSMIIDADNKLYSFGHPEHGQLGHNSEGKYFTSGNKYAFHCEYAPRRIVTFIEKSRDGHIMPVDDVEIVDVACGTNHTLAVDKRNRCYSWGFAGYHRLGHSETKNELVPRSIKLFDAPTNSGRGASRVFAGATHSMALDVNGLLYFWGQNKSSGEATMYPKNVQDLCGWRVSEVACANRSIVVIAEDTCISWGPSPTYGELCYGEGKSKSSTTPQEAKTLEGVRFMGLACGFGHTLLIAKYQNEKDQAVLNKLKSWP